MESKKVFISSTTDDLAQYRQEAVNVMNEFNEDFKGKFQLVEIHMDNQGSSGERKTPVAVSTGWVAKADWVVLIVAWNYGYVQEGQTWSVTEWEFRYSQETCKPPKECFVFLAGEITDTKSYERKDQGREKNLTNWDRSSDGDDESSRANRRRLKEFKKELRAREFKLFSDIDDFAEELRTTLKQKIDGVLEPQPFEEITKDRALLALILAQNKPIQAFLAEIKQLATLKRIHDHLHRIRQDGICRWRDEVMNLWEQESIGSEGRESYLEVLGSVRENRGPLMEMKRDLPREPCCRLDELIQKVLDFDLPKKESLSTLKKLDFERKVDDFARLVQSAFWAADQAMRGRKDALRKQHTAMIKELSIARRDRALSTPQDQKLDEGLEQVETRLNEMEAVLERHSRWQNIHNALENLDPFIEQEEAFRDELIDFLKSNAAEVLVLAEEARTVLARLDGELFESKARAIRSLVDVDPSQWENLSAGAYGSMRKAFDVLFFEMDTETRAFVDQSDERVKTYNETLNDLESQVKSRAVRPR